MTSLVQSHKIIGVVARKWRTWKVYTEPVTWVTQLFPSALMIHFEDGRDLCVDEIKAIILDNGKVVKMKKAKSK